MLNWKIPFSACLVIAFPVTGDAQTSQNTVAVIVDSYSCAEADEIKFDRSKYTSMDRQLQVIVDGTYQKCEMDKEKELARSEGKPEPDEEVVILTNPAPTGEEDRLFYGTIKRADLENASKNCKGGAGVAALTVAVAGAATGAPDGGQGAALIYQYGDVVCDGLAQAVEEGNLLVILNSQMVVGHAVAKEALTDAVKSIPLVSDADKENVQKLIDNVTAVPEIKVDNNKVEVSGGGVRVELPLPPIPKKLPDLKKLTKW